MEDLKEKSAGAALAFSYLAPKSNSCTFVGLGRSRYSREIIGFDTSGLKILTVCVDGLIKLKQGRNTVPRNRDMSLLSPQLTGTYSVVLFQIIRSEGMDSIVQEKGRKVHSQCRSISSKNENVCNQMFISTSNLLAIVSMFSSRLCKAHIYMNFKMISIPEIAISIASISHQIPVCANFTVENV